MTLLPCPFCGNDIAPKALDHNEIGNLGKGDFEYCANPYYSVVCRMNDDSPVPLANWQTGCGAAGGFRPTPEEAIAAWNRRADHLPDATKKVSNADRIRSMSDEELATWILKNIDCDKENIMCIPTLYKNSDKCDGRCRDGRLSWLKQPLKEE